MSQQARRRRRSPAAPGQRREQTKDVSGRRDPNRGPEDQRRGGSAAVEMDRLSGSSIVRALRRQPVWIVLAVSSGACAAFNGVFAKLTTTSLTSNLSSSIATFLSLSADNTLIDLAVRATFFVLNLVFNALMWALFTSALTRAESTTRVSIVNVSANFVITAVLGALIFGEKLKGMWWVGAGMLAVGNVVIGRREEGGKPGGNIGLDETRGEAEQAERMIMGGEREQEQERGGDHRAAAEGDLVELDDNLEGPTTRGGETQSRLRKGEEADDPI
ncbi:uncharacterized protein Z520_00504 [Fonsecaea multimorphosa CBS 102226]|uniref:EamA domain-containing protein n=1 Tax=Fonsecaea multimorphosa CBS 102226 TaxID=1442371 RepID=A0A0D2KCD2_9EURO|nr:uncharacterized protein Z520_00504 [Fonsecaea multimorphosa CBS 102226]KIY03813.1 hypothetical protein Z520_00504 [Fonsecaea multimorphosa CBS 102226]OAL32505.1 hypothetical protein AYO22_00527 [Fonsecaea multimorphosa]